MKQGETPYNWLIIISSSEDLDSFSIEFFVFQFPENLTPVKQILIKNVLSLKIVINLTVTARAKNVCQALFLGDGLSGSNRQNR